MLLLLSSPAVASDPYSAYVVSLCHFNGTTVTDEVSGWTWSLQGSAATTTTAPIRGARSLDAPLASYAEGAFSDSRLDFGTGDFTVELTGRWPSVSPNDFAVPLELYADTGGSYDTGNIRGQFYFNAAWPENDNLFWWCQDAPWTGGTTIPSPAWDGSAHVLAYSRVSGVGHLYFDGVRIATGPDTYNYIGANRIRIGSGSPAEFDAPGQYDELRITKGIGRYSGTSYALPIGEYPNPPGPVTLPLSYTNVSPVTSTYSAKFVTGLAYTNTTPVSSSYSLSGRTALAYSNFIAVSANYSLTLRVPLLSYSNVIDVKADYRLTVPAETPIARGGGYPWEVRLVDRPWEVKEEDQEHPVREDEEAHTKPSPVLVVEPDLAQIESFIKKLVGPQLPDFDVAALRAELAALQAEQAEEEEAVLALLLEIATQRRSRLFH